MNLIERVKGYVAALPALFWGSLLLYLLLAALYAAVTPIFEKPDEHWHFAFSMYLVETGQLPVQELHERAHLAEQEGSQPPLYYGLLAGLLKLAGLNDLEEGYAQLTRENPHYGGRPGAWLENPNQFLHTPCVGPCAVTARAVYLGRALSILAGALALLAAAAALRLAFPDRPYLLFGTVGAIAFNPQFLHISSSVSNDALTVAMVNLAFALALWWLRRPDRGWRLFAIGLGAGLATLAKPSGLSLLVTMGLFLLVVGGPGWQGRLRQAVLFGVGFAGVSGWWFARNLLLYGEPTATQIHLQVYGTPAPPLNWGRFVAEWTMVANSYWASFGWGGINLPHPVYRWVTLLALGLFLLSLVAILRRWWGWSLPQRALLALALLQLLVVAGLLFRWMRLTVAPLGRLLFPAALPIALLLLFGLLTFLPRRLERPVALGYIGAWAISALLLALFLVRPLYVPSPTLESLPPDAIPLEIRFGDSLLLAGYRAPTGPLAPNEVVELTLFWRALAPIEEEFTIGTKLFGRDDQLLAQRDSYPDAGRQPMTTWPVGPLIPDRQRLLISGDALTPTVAAVEIDVFRLSDLSWLPAVAGGETLRPFRPITLVVRERETPAPTAGFTFRPVPQAVTLEEEAVAVDFIWEVGQPLEKGYQAFFHLAPAPDQPPARQEDFAPLGGDFPTSYWWPGDRLADRARLSLPADVPAGSYLLLLGLYDLESGSRVAGEEGRSVWVMGELQWNGSRWQLIERTGRGGDGRSVP